jgi:hypothetical protein
VFGVPIRLCGHVRARPARARLSGFAWLTHKKILHTGSRKPNPAAAPGPRTDVAQSMCGSREQRVLTTCVTTIAVVVSACVNPYPTRVDPYTVASVDT